MAIETLSEIKAKLAAGSRLLGLDVGAQTVGLALSDVPLTVATPYQTLRRGKFADDARRLGAIVDDEGVGADQLWLRLPPGLGYHHRQAGGHRRLFRIRTT